MAITIEAARPVQTLIINEFNVGNSSTSRGGTNGFGSGSGPCGRQIKETVLPFRRRRLFESDEEGEQKKKETKAERKKRKLEKREFIREVEKHSDGKPQEEGPELITKIRQPGLLKAAVIFLTVTFTSLMYAPVVADIVGANHPVSSRKS